jgi:hypothetical protein
MQWKNCIMELQRTRLLFLQAARKFDVKFPYSMTTENTSYVNFLRAPYTLKGPIHSKRLRTPQRAPYTRKGPIKPKGPHTI